MDMITLIAVVDAALTRLAERLPAPAGQRQIPPDLQESLLEHELSKDIESVLAAQEEFSRPMMISSLSGSHGFHSQWVAPMLLREARHRNSAAAAVVWLEKVLSTRSAAGIAVATLWGLAPERPIAVLDDIQLVPFELLPASRQKRALAEQSQNVPPLAIPPFMWQAPTAALVLRVEITPYLRSPDTESHSNIAVDHHSLFDDIRLCLATSGPSTVIPGPGWFQYTDPDLEAAVLGAGTHLRHQEVTPLVLEENGAFDFDRAVALLRAFVRLAPGVKVRVRTAMERLNQALVRRSPADRALELAIALEALLVDSPGEHTFKIGLRAALLTSNDLEQRKRNRAIIEGMYKIRSSLMHSGQFSEDCRVRGYGNIPTADVVSEALRITALVVQNIIGGGAIPDWSALELSHPV